MTTQNIFGEQVDLPANSSMGAEFILPNQRNWGTRGKNISMKLHPRTAIVNNARSRIEKWVNLIAKEDALTYAELLWCLTQITASYSSDSLKAERDSE